MPSLIAENVVQVVAEYRSGGELVANVYHVHKGTAWSAPEILTLLGAFSSWETNDASPLRSSQVSLIRLVGTDLTSLTSDRVDQQLSAPISGGDLAAVLPNNVTFAVKANIGERGKGRNGRTFWIGLSEAMVVGSFVDDAVAGQIQSALNTLITDISAALPGASLGIIHTRVNNVPISPATFSSVDSFTYTNLEVDSQKDRLPGHKRHKRTVAP